MGRFILRRIAATLPVLFIVSLVVFAVVHVVPGDPVLALIGETGARMSPAQIEQIREELGLNDPLYQQYLTWLGKALRGDLGNSITTGQPVIQEILSQLPKTIQLAVAGLGLAVCLGLVMGVLAAVFHHRWIDTLTMVISMLGVSVPSFWLGLLFIYVFALQLGWVPVLGGDGLESLLLPAITLALGAAAVIARLVRSSMLDTMGQDYVTTARAKGLGERAVINRHALRNALIPAVTIIGLQFGNLLAGTVVIETVFSRQGLGRLLVEGIVDRDFPIVQGTILFTTVIYILANLQVDVIYALLNPRIRYE